jgi:cell division transport system permease protein
VIAWAQGHWRALTATLGKLAANPFNTLFNSLVIGVALALPAGGYVVLDTLRDLSGGLSGDAQLTVFLDLEAKPADAADLQPKLRKLPGVASLRLVTREQALARLKQTEGMGDVVASLGFNPLPDALVVTASDSSEDTINKLVADIKALPKVARVQVDSAWIKRLGALLRLGRLAVVTLASLFAAALVAVVFNTIRLQILTQRDEIEVAKLIGATNSFIRRPFFYLGALQGASGGIAGCLIAMFGIWLLNRPILEFARLYGSEFQVRQLPPIDALAVISVAGLLGWLGAFLSVSKHLWQIEPK